MRSDHSLGNKVFRKVNTVSILLVLFLVSGCEKKVTDSDSDVLPGDYFPLNLGRSWTFSYVDTSRASAPLDTVNSVQVWTIIGTATLPPGGTQAYIIRNAYDFGFVDTFFIAKKSNFVATYYESSDAYPMVILPLPVRNGAQAIVSGDTAQIVGIESVATFTGTFDNCAKVRIRLSSGQAGAPGRPRLASQESEMFYWFAPGVGKVKWMFIPTFWYILYSYLTGS